MDVMGSAQEGILSVITPSGHQMVPIEEFTNRVYEFFKSEGFEWPPGGESDLTAISEWLLSKNE